MKKQLEAELVSLAHRILQLKNRGDIDVLYTHAQKLYESLAVLRFAEMHLQDQQPTIGLPEVYAAVEVAQDEQALGFTATDLPTAEDIANEMAELQAEIKAELQAEIKAELQNEVKAELQAEIKSELQAEMKSELHKEVKAELRKELQAELTESLKAEIHDVVKAEVQAIELPTFEAAHVKSTPEASEEIKSTESEESVLEEEALLQIEEEAVDAQTETVELKNTEEANASPESITTIDEAAAQIEEETAVVLDTDEAASESAIEESLDEEETVEFTHAFVPAAETVHAVDETEVENPFFQPIAEIEVEEQSLAEEKADIDADFAAVDLSMDQPILNTLDVDFFVPVTPTAETTTPSVEEELAVVDTTIEQENDKPLSDYSIDDLFQAFEPKNTENTPAKEDAFLTFDFAPVATSTPEEVNEAVTAQKIDEPQEQEKPTSSYFDLATPAPRPGLDNELRTTLNERLSKGITIGLNDRVAYIKHLFNNSSEDYNRVLSQLMTLGTLEEAKDFIEHMVKPDYNNWNGKEEFAARFMDSVEKRFV